MKVDRLDVAHEEIIDNCEEYVIVSASKETEDGYTTRAYISTDGELLKEIIINEMNNSEKFSTFMQEVINDYNNQKLY